jgi:tetratricopeptide (TPR) repeat protein
MSVRLWQAKARLLRVLNDGGMKREAAQCHRNALALDLGAIDSAFALLELAENAADLLAQYRTQQRGRAVLEAMPWFEAALQARSCYVQCEHGKAQRVYETLCERYPDNSHVLRELAECHVQLGRVEEPRRCFEHLHRVEPLAVAGMDVYGILMEREGQAVHLNKLSQHLLAVDRHRPETWTTLALAAKKRGDRGRALSMVKRALQLDPCHGWAQLLLALLLYEDQQFAEASRSFRAARLISPESYPAYKGLVVSALKLERPDEARALAEEMRRRMSSNPRAIALYGEVIHSVTGNARIVGKCAREALRIDPDCIEAILSLASYFARQSKIEDGIAYLQERLDACLSHRFALHCRIAQYYEQLKRLQDALEHYKEAARCNPLLEEAATGFARVQRELRGGGTNSAAASSGGKASSFLEDDDDNDDDGEEEEEEEEEEEDDDADDSLDDHDDDDLGDFTDGDGASSIIGGVGDNDSLARLHGSFGSIDESAIDWSAIGDND